MAQRFSFDDDDLIPFIGLDESQGLVFDTTDFMELGPLPSAETDADWGFDLDPYFMDDQIQLDGGDPAPLFFEEANSVQDAHEAIKEEQETKEEQAIPKKRKDCYHSSRRAEKVFFDGKLVTFGAIVKREFRYSDTNEEVTSAEKNRMNIFDGKAYFGGRELIWNPRYKKDSLNSRAPGRSLILDGKEITRDAFYKRNYIFEGSDEQVTHKELVECVFLNDGPYVNGRKIVWAPGTSKRKLEATSEPSSDERQAKKARTSPEEVSQQDESVSSPQMTQHPSPFMQQQEYRPTSYPDTLFAARPQQHTTTEVPESQYTSKFLLQVGNVRGLH